MGGRIRRRGKRKSRLDESKPHMISHLAKKTALHFTLLLIFFFFLKKKLEKGVCAFTPPLHSRGKFSHLPFDPLTFFVLFSSGFSTPALPLA